MALGYTAFSVENVAIVASRWQQCVRIDRPRFEPQIYRSRKKRVIAQPNSQRKEGLTFNFRAWSVQTVLPKTYHRCNTSGKAPAHA